jgi:hypothetical protein
MQYYCGGINTIIGLGLHFRVDKALWLPFGSIFYSIRCWLNLLEHSLIAVDVNQSLHENLGGYFGFRCIHLPDIGFYTFCLQDVL